MWIFDLFKKKENKPFEFPKCKPIPMPKGIQFPKELDDFKVEEPYMPTYFPSSNLKEKEPMFLRKLEIGLGIECSHEAFENIITEKYIQEHFTLNIKRLENNRYSIYFDEKKDLFIKWC